MNRPYNNAQNVSYGLAFTTTRKIINMEGTPMWIVYAVMAGVLLLDRISKILVLNNIQLFKSIPVIPKVLNFTYVRNTGAAFSMFSDANTILGIVAVVVVIGALIFLHIKKYKNPLLYTFVGMIIGGALGNVIDRFCYNYVIDFIDVQFMEFAVFNIADCFIVVGCILLAGWIMFYDAENSEVRLDDRN